MEEEKINGQKFYIDMDLCTDMRKSGVSDELEETVNYAEVCSFVDKYLKENRFNLIEAAAEHTVRELLKRFPKIKGADMTINKPSAPIGLPFGNVAVKVSRRWNKVILSIGSNMGDKEAYLNGAIDGIYDNDNCRINTISKFIETEPYGPVEQDNFLNGCLEIETLYSPEELLEVIHDIELQANRTREIHWGPRTLDLDILFYDDLILDTPDLHIPHADMANREFVLQPLSDIAGDFRHPVINETVNALLAALKKQSN